MLQPLNVDVFEPLTQAYRNELKALTRFGLRYVIDKVNFIKMYQKARSTVMRPEVIQSAWTKSELLSFNSKVVLDKLPFRDPRPNTPSEMTLTSSNGASLTVLFTSSNSAEVNLLIERIVKHDDEDAQTSKKLTKTCTSAIANHHLMTVTNKDLIQVAERQHEKNTRTRDHYGEVKVMNQEVLEERAQQAVSKAKGRSDREGNLHMNQVLKAFMRLDPIIFADSKRRSPKKRTRNSPSSEPPVFRPSPLILPSFTEYPLSVSLSVSKQQRKRPSKPKEVLKQQPQAPSQFTRSDRLIRPRNLDL